VGPSESGLSPKPPPSLITLPIEGRAASRMPRTLPTTRTQMCNRMQIIAPGNSCLDYPRPSLEALVT
jgi:hypothetical protein